MQCFKQHTVVLNVLDDVIYQKKKKVLKHLEHLKSTKTLIVNNRSFFKKLLFIVFNTDLLQTWYSKWGS